MSDLSPASDPLETGPARLQAAAGAFVERLARMPGAHALAVPDFAGEARRAGQLRRAVDWRNRVWQADGIRRAHVEYFAIEDQIAVLHVCVFPALDRGAPVFGFDVISGNRKATGAFLDLSPTVPEAEPAIARWGTRARSLAPGFGILRTLPEWGTIFSEGVIAVRPHDGAAIDAAAAFALESLEACLGCVTDCDTGAMRAAQNRYIAGQRANPHTHRMLAGCVGDDLAEAFIRDVLFPQPDGREPPSA
jgi:phycocyanobilin:ferredoxin oxidoreductase